MNLKRYLAIAVFFLALFAGAATAADRSPFAQGHWWNPARAGNGFEFFNVGDSAMIIWYTYEESGRPVWYTAQGSVAKLGAEPWQIFRHRWIDGRKAPAVDVGWLRIALGSFEAATLTWNLGGSQGTWPIKPFVASDLPQTLDRTGSWFDPSNSGWGVSLTEQGDVFGGVLFTYDAAGEPTWAAGFGREREVAELFTFDGACPSCAYRASSPSTVGRVAFDFIGDTQAIVHNRLTLPMAAGTNIDGATIVQLGRPVSSRPGDPDTSPPPPPPPPPPAPPPSGMLFSFAEANAVGAPNSDAQVSIQRTGGASGAFDIYYKFEGPGCARTGAGGPVRFADGDVGPKAVSVPMGVKGQCLVWIVPPPAPAGVGAPNGIGITVVPLVAGCPTPSNVVYAELGGIGNPLLQMQRSGQTVFMPLPAAPAGRASAKVVFSESAGGAYTPQPVTLEISISRCPGVIATDGGYCELHSTNGNYNAITYFTQPYQTLITDSSTANRYGYCWAGDAGQYYVSARWTYSSCAFGVAECGFAIQHGYGPF
jgi:hypothetical protein